MDALILVAWPDMLVRTFGTWYDAPLRLLGLQVAGAFYRTGHVAVLLASEATGSVHYFDFGRYAGSLREGRVRDQESDPRLSLPVPARFGRDGRIANVPELLRGLYRLPAVRDRGRMEAAALGLADLGSAYQEAKALQARGLLDYGNFRPGALNCGRFALRLAGHACSPLAAGLLRLASRLPCPGPSVLVHLLHESGVFKHGDSEGARSRLTPEKARGIGAFLEPPRPPGLPEFARWLPCVSAGSWVALDGGPGLGKAEYRFRRFLADGGLECDRVFAATSGRLDLERPYEFGHPTHGLACTVLQDGQVLRLVLQKGKIKYVPPRGSAGVGRSRGVVRPAGTPLPERLPADP